jgi:hypothetical protein
VGGTLTGSLSPSLRTHRSFLFTTLLNSARDPRIRQFRAHNNTEPIVMEIRALSDRVGDAIVGVPFASCATTTQPPRLASVAGIKRFVITLPCLDFNCSVQPVTASKRPLHLQSDDTVVPAEAAPIAEATTSR